MELRQGEQFFYWSSPWVWFFKKAWIWWWTFQYYWYRI